MIQIFENKKKHGLDVNTQNRDDLYSQCSEPNKKDCTQDQR